MINPIKYKLYQDRLWVKGGVDEKWKVARANVSANRLTPISQNFGNDFVWTKAEPVIWKGRYFYKDIIGVPGHNGIDFTAPTGACLYAPHDGTVAELLDKDGLGIRLIGEGKTSIFFHLQEFLVNLKQEVKQGDLIALTDNTGRYTTAPHLHWGVRPINYENDAHSGYYNFKDEIENLDVYKLPYNEGQCLMRTQAKGEFYVVENGELTYKNSSKINKHIEIVDFFINKRKTGLPPGFIKSITEVEFNKYRNLVNVSL